MVGEKNQRESKKNLLQLRTDCKEKTFYSSKRKSQVKTFTPESCLVTKVTSQIYFFLFKSAVALAYGRRKKAIDAPLMYLKDMAEYPPFC